MELNKYLAAPYGKETKEFRKNGGIVLSPSSISKFFDNPGEWWNDRNGVVTFDGNTNTVLGSVVHAMIESYYKGGGEITYEEIEDWMNKFYSEQMNTGVETFKGTVPKVDTIVVLKNCFQMFEVWKKEYGEMYVSETGVSEIPVSMKIGDEDDKIMVAGVVDRYEEEHKVVTDWKTTSKAPSKDMETKEYIMSKAHEFQMSSYAMALIANGKEVDTIRCVYIQKPTTKLPARIYVIDKELTDEMLFRTVGITENMRKSIVLVQDNPELVDFVFRENPLSMWN